MSISSVTFPLPVSLFSRDLVGVCSAALEQAWSLLGRERSDMVISDEVARMTLANGIVIAVTLGVRDPRRLTKAALDHLDHAASRCLPTLEPVADEARPMPAPERYMARAEELRAYAEDAKDARARSHMLAMSKDYERMARTAELIASSRKTLNGLPPRG